MKKSKFLERSRFLSVVTAILGACLFMTYQVAQAVRTPPSEHKGLGVSSLGVVNEESMEAQLGLSGYKLQLREIVVEPGGQIAKHDHSTRPGLVLTLSGSWVEGRPEGEKEYPDSLKEAIVEDKDTVHWFWNDGNVPARIAVCDIVPAS